VHTDVHIGCRHDAHLFASAHAVPVGWRRDKRVASRGSPLSERRIKIDPIQDASRAGAASEDQLERWVARRVEARYASGARGGRDPRT
jgi:hypothetical protein